VLRKWFWLGLPLILCANEDFISTYEYGSMLYQNPRGVSCAKCHGESGEGRLIATYQTKEGKVAIVGVDLRNKSLQELISSINRYHPIMPTYSLTNQEVAAIYRYIQEKNRSEEK